MFKIDFYKKYLKEEKLKNTSFDCSEIADDLLEYYKEGYLIKITVEENPHKFFKVWEFGKEVEVVYHTVYTDGINIYDPRYKEEPIETGKYIKELQKINKDNLKIETE